MRRIWPTIWVLISFLIFVPVSSDACDMCIIDKMPVPEIRGVVVDSTSDMPIADAVCDLVRRSNTDKIIKSVQTNTDGSFYLRGIRPGQYWLTISAPPFIHLQIPIQVLEIRTKKEFRVDLKVCLGVRLNTTCGGGRVEASKRRLNR